MSIALGCDSLVLLLPQQIGVGETAVLAEEVRHDLAGIAATQTRGTGGPGPLAKVRNRAVVCCSASRRLLGAKQTSLRHQGRAGDYPQTTYEPDARG